MVIVYLLIIILLLICLVYPKEEKMTNNTNTNTTSLMLKQQNFISEMRKPLQQTHEVYRNRHIPCNNKSIWETLVKN